MTTAAAPRFLATALVALVLTPVLATVVTTDLFIVGEEDVLAEDVYVAAQSGSVEGTIQGDLTFVGGDLTITGTVTGSVNALSAASVTVSDDAIVEGSLRIVARQATIAGTVGADIVSTAITTRIDSGAVASRDLITFGGTLDVAGAVGRDVRGRVFAVGVGGSVGNDLDVTVSRLTVRDGAVIGGDVLYRSAGRASITEGATVNGQVIALPSSPSFLYGVILTLANIVSLLAFLVIGFVIIWLFRGTARRAARTAIARPLRSLLVGTAATVVTPVLVVLFAVTLVGLPIALALLVIVVLGLVVGPIPIVTALGDRLVRRRGGLFGGFLVGALLWRLGIWFIPWVGGLLFLAGLVWGVGAWLVAAWEQRGVGNDVDLLPPAMRVDEDVPDFEFPLPPRPRKGPNAERTGGEEAGGEGEGAAPTPAAFGDRVSAITADPERADSDRPAPAPDVGGEDLAPERADGDVAEEQDDGDVAGERDDGDLAEKRGDEGPAGDSDDWGLPR